MHLASLPVRHTFLAATWLLALSFQPLALAQTPTTEQLQIFQSLTPEQQQALLRQTEVQSGTTEFSSRISRQAVTEADAERRSGSYAVDEEAQVPVFKAGDTLGIEISVARARPAQAQPANGVSELPPVRQSPADDVSSQRRQRLVESLDIEGRRKLDELIDLVLSHNPYVLDRDAQLNLPGTAPIALGGLTEEQATKLLSLEPILLPVEVHISRLPVGKSGIAGLKHFGYELFENAPSTFSPVTDVPVPADYVIGPGDQLSVQLFGSQNRSVPLTVNRDGVINFPGLGPMRVGGLTFNATRRTIESRVSQQMIGVQASVALGDMRGIRVLVLGMAKLPGSYTVPGLATMTTALYASGGVKEIGSLRDIQLKRQGEVVRRLDLYDLLIKGDTSDDAKLLPGDVIFIPPVGPTVSVDGEFKRPAIYELRNGTSVAEMARIAGGFTAEADLSRGNLTRIDANGRRHVLDVNLSQSSGSGIEELSNGDVLRIMRLRPHLDSGIVLEGHVHRPGSVAWREGLRLTQVIGSVDELKPGADQSYVLIRREGGPNRRVSVLSADLSAALAAPNSPADVRLEPRDRLFVFDLASGRERIIQPLLDELRLQSELSRPTETVRVSGKVKVPGEYPLEPNMRVSDLLRAGGNLDSSAFGGRAEVTRYTLTSSGTRQTELIEIDLAAVRRGDTAADIRLQSFDVLLVLETPDWTDNEHVTLHGEVRFPGTYSLLRGETLRQLLDRAGGLTSLAFPAGSVFTRTDLKIREQQQLDRLAEQMRKDLAGLALQSANAGQTEAAQALQSGQGLLQQLLSAKATGRFVIDLPELLAAQVGGERDVALRDGDELTIPRIRSEVTVIGEVQNATSHMFLSNLKRNDYIGMSGGTTRKADNARIYIVRANGSVATRRGTYLARNYENAIKPGDTIIVPLDTERMPTLPLWQAITQILYNVAVSVAAVNSF